ncbi:MAG: hypothetical protein RLZZ604_896 [Pseudomonadota bacterium]
MPGNDEQKIGNDRTVTDPVIDRPVVLVGMMGVGKSSIGKRLAARLNVPFADADDEIDVPQDFPFPKYSKNLAKAIFAMESDGLLRGLSRVHQRLSPQAAARSSMRTPAH